jgi:Ca-activated chloride channel family protein
VPEGAKPGDVPVADIEVSYNGAGGVPRISERTKVSLRLTNEPKEEASLNKEVMGDISIQLANEVHEQAVQLRDSGQIDAAKKLLQGYAQQLDAQAANLSIAGAAPMAEQFRSDADKLDSETDWNRTRKAMKAYEYRNKTQQSY